jgi:hypothetical protein
MVRFSQLLTMKFIIFWSMTPYRLIDVTIYVSDEYASFIFGIQISILPLLKKNKQTFAGRTLRKGTI